MNHNETDVLETNSNETFERDKDLMGFGYTVKKNYTVSWVIINRREEINREV